MARGISLDELPAGAREKALAAMGKKRGPRKQGMSLDRVRGRALQVLELCHDLTQRDRRRVLKKALEINEV